MNWFCNIVTNILIPNDLVKKHLEYNSSANLSFLKYEFIKNTQFLDSFQIVDVQQAEFIIEIMKTFNFIMKIENEKENLIVLPNYFINNSNCVNSNLIIWPANDTNLDGCFQATSIYEFFYDLPNLIQIQIHSHFLKLTNVNYISKNCLICQEGCFNIFIQYDSAKSNPSIYNY